MAVIGRQWSHSGVIGRQWSHSGVIGGVIEKTVKKTRVLVGILTKLSKSAKCVIFMF